MLIKFSVANYKSVGEKQTLYMQPSSPKAKRDGVFETGVFREPLALSVAAILGANASGKTTFLDSFSFLKQIVKTSAERKKTDSFQDKRFKLNAKYASMPTEFEIEFVAKDKNFYKYELAIFPEKICFEKLVRIFPEKRSREVSLIERRDGYVNLNNIIYHDKYALKVWGEDINDKMTFLSYLGNKGSVDVFDSVIEWFNNISIIDSNIPYVLTSSMISDGAVSDGDVLKLILDSGIDISKIQVNEKKADIPIGILNFLASTIAEKENADPAGVIQRLNEAKDIDVSFCHKTVDGDDVYLDFDEESEGTKTFFSYSGPIIEVLEKGKILIIDELERSLHPYLVRKIAQMFSDPEKNTSGAQLIFTTHDITVMDKSLLSPDQIYLTEKDKDSFETSLYSLSEFKNVGGVVKNDRGQNLYKSYLEGRFGGVPDIVWL